MRAATGLCYAPLVAACVAPSEYGTGGVDGGGDRLGVVAVAAAAGIGRVGAYGRARRDQAAHAGVSLSSSAAVATAEQELSLRTTTAVAAGNPGMVRGFEP